MHGPDPDDGDGGESDDARGLSRRESLALLGAAGGFAFLAGCGGGSGDTASPGDTAPGTTAGEGGLRRWDRGVDASGNGLWNVGSLSFDGDYPSVRSLTGDGLSVDDEGALSVATAETGLPSSYHVVNDYPGDTLDQKLRAAIDEAVAAGIKSGHRFLVPPPDTDDPAADGGPAWRFEEPIVIERDHGGFYFDFGRTHVHATAEMPSFFVIGPDEKTEGISIDGGVFGAGGNLTRSFLDVQGIGHMFVNQTYLAGGVANGRNSVPAGIRYADGHGSSELTVTDTEVTGCTDGFLATQTADVPFGAAFDLDIYNFRAGGGETSVRIDGGVGVNLHSIQAGGHPVQSVSDSIVRFENSRNAVRKANVSFVRERHNSRAFHSGVRVADVTDGTGPRHDGVSVRNVDVYHAEYGTDLEYVDAFDQQNVRPPPAPVGEDAAGTSRWFGPRQVFDSTRGHEFRVDGEARLDVGAEGVRFAGAGGGPILTAPDGGGHYRLRVDADGNLSTEAVDLSGGAHGGLPPAGEATVVDGFEDGDLDEYEGDTGGYVVDPGAPVGEGEYSLKSLDTDSGPLVSTAGLGDYPSAGDTLAAKVAQTDAHPFVGVAWGVQDTENFYWTRVDTTENSLGLWKLVDGEPTNLGRTFLRLDDAGTVYEFVVDWGADGAIDAALLTTDGARVASVSGRDATFEAGGVGLRQGGMLDHVRFW